VMAALEDVLSELLDQEVFELDEDEIEKYLSDFDVDKVVNSLIKRLELASLSENEIEDISWKLGRIFGDYEKIHLDSVLVSKFATMSINMKIVCMNFLSGYWDQTASDLKSLKPFFQIVAESIASNSWPNKLSDLSVEVVAIYYGNYKDQLLLDDELRESVGIVKSYAESNIENSPGKSLLASVVLHTN
jgi:hypothetical protein